MMRAKLAGAFAALVVSLAGALSAGEVEEWYEPKRGTAERKALMNAFRPIAEWQLGEEVQFVVEELRVFEDTAFAMLDAQRRDGSDIDLEDTPLFANGILQYFDMDGSSYEVFYQKSGGAWVPVLYQIGATEAWWIDGRICEAFYIVIEEWCVGVY
jgi:hypothetical protein